MHITARIHNDGDTHHATVSTDGRTQQLTVAAKAAGRGSSVNGGEFLLLALATCYCNDIYREAARLDIAVHAVDVEALADFEGVGLAATNIRYRARIESPASETAIRELLRHTDAVAEVQNTVRQGVVVSFEPWPG